MPKFASQIQKKVCFQQKHDLFYDDEYDEIKHSDEYDEIKHSLQGFQVWGGMGGASHPMDACPPIKKIPSPPPIKLLVPLHIQNFS